MNSKGFTLIEVIIALAILSIVAVSFLELFMTSTKVNNMSKREIQGIYLAQKYLEEVKNDFDRMFSGSILIEPSEDPDYDYPITPGNEIYKKVLHQSGKGFEHFNIIVYFEKTGTKSGNPINFGSFNVELADFQINLKEDVGKTLFEIWESGYDEEDIPLYSTEDHDITIKVEKLGQLQYKIEPINGVFSTFKNEAEGHIVFKVLVMDDNLSKTTLTIDNRSDKSVLVYKYDDFDDILDVTIAEGTDKGNVQIISNIIGEQASQVYSEDLYKVIVKVKYNDKKYAEMMSMIRK
ncbi:MAG: hypothetical protein PWQ37_1190 [Candidatus Petromonas sp.]|jgi:prepilin-type N-terminal cleavage/methylation domain-containing protein|nr:hypothetical protein [Candidatus Petromonas sp.]